MLEDNNLDDEEAQELFDTLHKFGGGDFELGEIQKATRLHFDDPPPSIDFQGPAVLLYRAPSLTVPEATAGGPWRTSEEPRARLPKLRIT